MGNNAIYVQLSHKMFVICINKRQNQIFSEMSLRDVMELPKWNTKKATACVGARGTTLWNRTMSENYAHLCAHELYR